MWSAPRSTPPWSTRCLTTKSWRCSYLDLECPVRPIGTHVRRSWAPLAVCHRDLRNQLSECFDAVEFMNVVGQRASKKLSMVLATHNPDHNPERRSTLTSRHSRTSPIRFCTAVYSKHSRDRRSQRNRAPGRTEDSLVLTEPSGERIPTPWTMKIRMTARESRR
jgi:hypothetical protein